MPTIRQVDPATLTPQAEPAPDPLGPSAAPAAAAPMPSGPRIAVPAVPRVKQAHAESVGGVLNVTVPLPDGGVALLRKPAMSLKMAVSQIVTGLGVQDDQAFRQTVEAVLHVATINGEAIQRPVNHVERQKLLNKLGDDAIGVIQVGYAMNFGVVVEIDLPLSEPQ